MCVSRLHKVIRVEGVFAEVENVDGVRHRASLLALEGPEPQPGEWLVVHSGYALARADQREAQAVAEDLRRVAEIYEDTKEDHEQN